MKLTLKNIGRISEASVAIDGITVIAGENNTGKSTIGKALFSVFNSFYNIENRIRAERVLSLESALSYLVYKSSMRRVPLQFYSAVSDRFLEEISKERTSEEIRSDVLNILQQFNGSKENIEQSVLDEVVTRIQEVLFIPDDVIFRRIVAKNLNAEFDDQINNVFTRRSAKICLEIQGRGIEISITDNDVRAIKNPMELRTEAVYIDDPFVMDEGIAPPHRLAQNSYDHREHLRSKLFSDNEASNTVEEIVKDIKFKSIYEKVSAVCEGEVVKQKNRIEYGYEYKNKKVLNIRNLSTGMKTFAILKMLLMNGAIEYNGAIILDEPEIHLHPEWQLLFAELIVLIHKEFGMHVLLNTHSPYFLQAIEVYSLKHGVTEKCRYYLAEAQGDTSIIRDVTDSTEAIYKKLARPLQILENERYSCE